MGKECILAIDQGTTNTKALLVDRRGAPVFRGAMQIPLISTPQGFTEQDPELIWDSVANVAISAAEYAKAHGYSVAAIAISNQRETALAWDVKSGKAAAALLKKGFAMLEMGQKAEAVVQLQYVINEQPASEEARLARAKLKSLGIEAR